MRFIDEADKRLAFIDPDNQKHSPGMDALINNWWVYHPIKGCVFFRQDWGDFPQCHLSKSIVLRVQKTMYPWAIVKLVPIVHYWSSKNWI